jgi:signal transduction histidine kinase
VDITLRFQPEGTDLIVQDDGCGLEEGLRQASGPHFGLLGIRERVDKLGGVLHISGERGAGTRLSVTIPSRRPPVLGFDRAGGG